MFENRNCGRKSKLWSKIEIVVKNDILIKNVNFGQKSKCWSKIETVFKK